MPKKQKSLPEPPSKAYLVSFGDTMTALLAFFIVINSMAQEQTGANLYSGTGSFVSAVSSIGFSGTSPTSHSQYLTKKTAPVPLYALSENLDKNPDQAGNLGPDDEHDEQRKIDREKENFQRFLNEIDREFRLNRNLAVKDQIVFDSFELFKDDGQLSGHALQLLSELTPMLKDDEKFIEVVVWATMPSPTIIEKTLNKSTDIIEEIESKFNISPAQKQRLRVIVKPWLFSDAKRPVISFVVGNYTS